MRSQSDPGVLSSGYPARTLWLAGVVLAAAAAAVYWKSLRYPFVFDDITGVDQNASIRHLWPPTSALLPPPNTTVNGRPMLNLSFAVNYALSGHEVWSYRALNLLIHILAGLTLFGVVRRSLLKIESRKAESESESPRRDAIADSMWIAFAVALLWIVHPLQTESVTYVVQRAESLMGLFYLLTLYCFIRGTGTEVDQSGNRKAEIENAVLRSSAENIPLSAFRFPIWSAWSFIACMMGMATKEVMASAPVIVLLYDRTFVAGSFKEALRRRLGFYLGLASTWILAAYLALGTHGRSGTSGFGIGIRWWDYFLTQFPALVRYLRLSFWPQGQIFDYGALWVERPVTVLPAALVVAALVAATVWAHVRRPPLGFLGVWFFAILSPTSLIPGNRQTIAEHRTYLALAPILVMLVLAVHQACVRLVRRSIARRRVFLAIVLVTAVVLGGLTVRRNGAYRSHLALWEDTVEKNPGNALARNDLANAYLADHRIDDALAQYEEALRLKTDYPEGHNNRGTALASKGRLVEAVAEYREAIRLHKGFYPDAHNNLGVSLMEEGDVAGALVEFKAILDAQPSYVDVHFNYANALRSAGRLPEAVAEYHETMGMGLDIPELHNNLGNALAGMGRLPEAIAEYVAALRLRPDYADAYHNIGSALVRAGRLPEAIGQYQHAVRLRPKNVDTRIDLADALAYVGRLAEAEKQYGEVLLLRPDSVEARNNLANVLAKDDQLDEAVAQYRATLRLGTNSPEVHNNLGVALLRLDRRGEATAEFETALRLRPDYAKARANLDRMLQPQESAPR